ncbi:MAG TPA: hypothetical protein VG870_10570, partial [Chitinophagaceae bacterium]|nr:hypothetical protein [Chitinophagaceae bacterium]
PDIGMRGLAVKKLDCEADLVRLLPLYTVDYLIQEFVPYEKEVGIFYYRVPGQERGVISGIVGKELLTVTGDGQQTVRELLRQDARYLLHLGTLHKQYGEDLERVPARGERKVLVPYGNHARGAKFLDYSHLADEDLARRMDAICRQVPEFYYGRLDIRYERWDDLKKGERFSIIELNGAGSEPTHIYDPRHSLLFAWKEIIRHWRILWQISRLNRRRGFPYMSFSAGRTMFRQNRDYLKKLRGVDRALIGER